MEARLGLHQALTLFLTPTQHSKELTMKYRLLALTAILAAGTSAALAQSQGVSKTEITLGSIQDLSGPIAGFGKQVRLEIEGEKTQVDRDVLARWKVG